MRLLTFSLLGLLSVLAACSSVQTSDTTVASAETRICQRETPTGTHMPTTRCRSVEEIERQRRSAETLHDQMGAAAAADGIKEPPGSR